MDEGRLGDLIEELWEDVEDSREDGPGTVLNKFAQRIMTAAHDEQQLIVTFLRYHFPNDTRIQMALDMIQSGVHREPRAYGKPIVVVVDRK